MKLQLLQDNAQENEVIGFAANIFPEGGIKICDIFTDYHKNKLECNHNLALLVKNNLSHSFCETSVGHPAKIYLKGILLLGSFICYVRPQNNGNTICLEHLLRI